MRKSFFKKLSLGMALALVLGTTAHAGVAQAAEAWTLKKDSKILYLNEDNTSGTKNFYDFNFKNKPENWKEDYSFAWSIADEEVATVAKGGVVTAVSVGKTVVSCEVTDKETKEVVAVVNADVTVKANAADVVISNKEAYGSEYGWFIPTGATIDLNRTMWDENGNSTTKRGEYVSDYTRWLATDMEGNVVAEDVVAINQTKGEFTFNVAGDYYLWCETYQSATNPETTAYDYFAVTVADETVEIAAKQDTLDTFVVSFSTALDATEFVKADFDAALVVTNADENTELVRSTELVYNEDKTLVTGVKVQLWNDFEHNMVYTVTCGEELTATFTASIGQVNKIVLKVVETGTMKAVEGENIVYVEADGKVETNKLSIAFLDAANIDVTANYKDSDGDVILDDVTFELTGDTDYFEFDEDDLTITVPEDEDAVGKKLKINAVYTIMDENGDDKVIATGSLVVTAKNAPAAKLNSIVAGVIVKTDDIPDYNEKQAEGHKKVVAANDENLYIAVSAIDNWGNTLGNKGKEEIGKFTFAVSNDQIAYVDEETGYFTPFTEGTVRVDIFYTDLSVDEDDQKAERVERVVVTIKKDREAAKLQVAGDAKLELDSNVMVTKNDDDELVETTVDVEGNVTFKFTVVDNHNEAVNAEKLAKLESGFVITSEDKVLEAALKDNAITWNSDAGVYELKVTNTELQNAIVAKGEKKSTINLKFTVALVDKDTAAAKEEFTVAVNPLTSTETKKYEVVVKDAIDVGMLSTADAKVDVTVYGLNSKGIRVEKVESLDKFLATTNVKDYTKADKDGIVAANELFGSATSGTALVWTITDKSGALVNANGSAVVTAATGGSLKLTSGEVMDVDGSSIKLATTASGSGLNYVYAAKTGKYTVTVYEIEKSQKSDGTFKYTYDDVCDATFEVKNNPLAINAKQVNTSTSEAKVPELGKKLTWTTDGDVKEIVTDCYEFTLKDVKEDATEEMDMAFEVRANGNTLYVKTVRIFYEVKGEVVVLEKSLNKTLTVTEK